MKYTRQTIKTMSIVEQNVSVSMLRDKMAEIPEFDLPEGFCVRWFEGGDIDSWVDLYSLADKYITITPELFIKEFGNDPEVLHNRICFILDSESKFIGTAAAWYDDGFQGQCWGRVHWVAIIPEMQGKGLAKPLMSIVLERLKHLGHDKAYLLTSTARVPAINLYRKFGFIPDVSTEEKQVVWKDFSRETGLF